MNATWPPLPPLAALALLATGCATVADHTRSGRPQPVAPAPPPALGPEAPAVVLALTDARPEPRDVIGSARSVLGISAPEVATPDDPVELVDYGLRLELARQGIRVVAPGGDPEAPVLGAEIVRMHCAAGLTYQGEVVLRAWLLVDGVRQRSQEYAGEGSAGTNWAGTAESYWYCLAMALKPVAVRIAADARRTLGKAAAPPPAR